MPGLTGRAPGSRDGQLPVEAPGPDGDGAQGGHISAEPRINDRIRVPEVRLVGPNGEQVGIVALNDALRLAQEADLDLVRSRRRHVPVCKLMDYGKFKYESALKARESRKNQAQTVIKEIKLRPKIDPHDYGTKKGHVERFLKQGDKVKVTIMFRGREQSRPELGFRLLQRLAGDVEELGFVEAQPKQDGRNMIMVIGPHRKKSETRTAAAATREGEAETPPPARCPGHAVPRPRRAATTPVALPAARQAARQAPRLRAGGRLTRSPAALSPPSRRFPGPGTGATQLACRLARHDQERRRPHAEDEDAQRFGQAVPAYRDRQGDPPPREHEPPARAQGEQADPTAQPRDDPRSVRREEDQEAAGEVAQPASRELRNGTREAGCECPQEAPGRP